MSDKKNIVPLIISIAAHGALIGLLVWNFAWDKVKSNHQYVEAPIQAQLVTAPTKSNPDATSLKRKQEAERKREQELQKQKELQHKKEQEILEREKQQQIQQEQQKQQQEKEAQAERQKQLELTQQKQLELEKQKKLEEQKQKAEQERKQKELEQKRIEEEKRKKAEAEAKRKAEQERKRKAKEEAERKKREEIERLEKELASQEDEFFEAELDNVRQGQILSEVDKISNLIAAKIIRNWNWPQHEGICVIKITTGPGGVVLDTRVVNGDDEYCITGEAAIKRSDPLPHSDDPDVLKEFREIEFTFDPSKKNR